MYFQHNNLYRLLFPLALILFLFSFGNRVNAEEDDSHLGLPPVMYPDNNQATPTKIALGQKIFFDTRLSGDSSISCASCHRPEQAFSDGLALAHGISKHLGTRNTPSIINAAFNTSQFWDGRRDTLESQALDPLLNPREHGLHDKQTLLTLLRHDRDYVQAFAQAFHVKADGIELEQFNQALASFERSVLVAGNSPFDRYYYAGEKTALAASAVRGLALFQGRANCTTCHVIGQNYALFTDNQFHSLSVGLKHIENRLPEITTRLVHLRGPDANLGDSVLSDEDIAELGRFAVTLQPVDIGKFRTPSLRNVALTAPYMHDGSVATLEEAVELEIYYRGTEAGHPLILTPAEKSDLVDFLKSLNSRVNWQFDTTSSKP